MNNEKKFFSNFTSAIGCSEATKKNGLWLLDTLLKNDPKNLTKFEASFKIKNNKIPQELRFLNFDAMAYSSRNKDLFLKRLGLFQKIMEGKVKNKKLENVFRALEKVSDTPLDLYFGADIENANFLFAFWLIFGGVKKDGSVDFWHYDINKIIKGILKKVGARAPQQLKSDILNLGLDIDDKDLFYKIYWLHNFSKDGTLVDKTFASKIKKIQTYLKAWRYFTFISEKYNLEGRCLYKKLFTEFLDPIDAGHEKLEDFLKTILRLAGSKFDFQKLLKTIKSINGRIALISFEIDDTLTFYIRPRHD